MASTLYLNPSEATESLRRAAFPDYTGRKFSLQVQSEPLTAMHSYWDGGSRDYWAVVELASMRSMPVPENGTPFTPELEGVESACLPRPGYAVVRHSMSRGKDVGLTFYLHPDNAAKFLPAPVELSHDEQIVLTATRSLKPSYAGISNYRFHEAHRDTGITLEAWDAAKAALIVRGLLNKAGALTTEGRNAAGSKSLWEYRRAS